MKKLLLSVALGALLTACAPDVPQTAETGTEPAAGTAAAAPARTAAEELHFQWPRCERGAP